MNGLQIDLVLVMLGAFACGLRLGRGYVVRADVFFYFATGIGLLLVQTNLMASLQLINLVVGSVFLFLGRLLAFGGAVALLFLASRRRATSL